MATLNQIRPLQDQSEKNIKLVNHGEHSAAPGNVLAQNGLRFEADRWLPPSKFKSFKYSASSMASVGMLISRHATQSERYRFKCKYLYRFHTQPDLGVSRTPRSLTKVMMGMTFNPGSDLVDTLMAFLLSEGMCEMDGELVKLTPRKTKADLQDSVKALGDHPFETLDAAYTAAQACDTRLSTAVDAGAKNGAILGVKPRWRKLAIEEPIKLSSATCGGRSGYLTAYELVSLGRIQASLLDYGDSHKYQIYFNPKDKSLDWFTKSAMWRNITNCVNYSEHLGRGPRAVMNALVSMGVLEASADGQFVRFVTT